MKKLLIKTSGITKPFWRDYNSGVGRSTYMLLEALSKQKNLPFEIEIYVNGLSSICFNFNNWTFKHFRFPIPDKWGNQKTNLESKYRKYFREYDLFHIPHNLDIINPNERFVVTLHDIIQYKDPNIDISIKKQWQKMANESQAIVTCSNYSKEDIVNAFNIDANKITVIYWGISEEKFHIEPLEITRSKLKYLKIEFPYFLACSCNHPRKNIINLLKAFRKYLQNKTDFSLILIWGNAPKKLKDEYSKEINKGKIVFLDYVSDDLLLSLYNGATVTFFPSKYEGFGFPILESFACGTPVVTCRNSSLTEVGNDLAIYVEEESIDGMVDYMKFFSDNKFDNTLFQDKASKYIKKFSWDKTAKNYINFYSTYI